MFKSFLKGHMVHSNELITTLTPVLCASPLFISSVKYLLVLQYWLLYFGICLMSLENMTFPQLLSVFHRYAGF